MPTFALQSVIPLLFMLALPWLDRRKVLLAWPLTHAPDIDYWLAPHRAVAHNVFVLLPFILVGIWAWGRGRADLVQWMVIVSIYLGSHMAMDVFAGGVTLLYPLSDITTCYYARIDVVTATNTPFLDAGRCTYTGYGVVPEIYNWLPSTEAAMLVFLIPATIAAVAWSAWRSRRGAERREKGP